MSISTKVFRLLNLNTKYRFPLLIQECQFKRSLRPALVEFKKRQDRADFKAVIPKLPNHRNTYLEWNYDSEIYAFGKRLKEEFDSQLLGTAFTHRSYIIQQEMKQRDLGIENPDIKLQDNRELIEEGEAFMREYIVTFLEAALPKFPLEGILALRDHLMTTEVLADVASHLGCKDIILSQEYPVTEEILSNTFKAIVSALIQSSDAARAGHFVRDFVITMLHHQDVNELWTVERPMEMLQELMKKAGMNEPELRLISESAKNTILACYRVGIYVDKKLFCDSFGESIPIAKEMAAREGLKVFFGTPDNMAPINYRLPVLPKQRTARVKSIQAS